MKNQKIIFLFFLGTLFFLLFFFWKNAKTGKEIISPVLLERGQEPVRKAAAAGSFYPADSYELDQKLTVLLNQAELASSSGKPRILIVPHAGVQFSGRTAASGFKQIQGKSYRNIILLGAAHQVFFDHVAIYDKGIWETPLGKIEIEENLANAFLEENKKIINNLGAHEKEHSLEMELIFLQKVLKNFKIVPILIGQVSEETLSALAKKISQNFDSETLFVVSSDLSHYPTWEVANEVDNKTIEAILTGKKEKLEETIKEIEEEQYPNVETAACGDQAIRVALQVAEDLEFSDFKKIKHENSGDVSGEKSRVVGYVSIGVWSEKIGASLPDLNKEAQEEAILMAKNTLEEFVKNGKKIEISTKNPVLSQHLGVFVTLRKRGELRGCIGEFEPEKPLSRVISEMTIAAASKDTRFLPVREEELKDINVEISVMSPRRKISNWKEIKLGKHGVVILKGQRGGTFLPQVATETGWGLEEFLGELCSQKVGLPPDCFKDPGVFIYAFEAQVFGEE